MVDEKRARKKLGLWVWGCFLADPSLRKPELRGGGLTEEEMAAMEEVLALVPGFVDILVLAGGRASSGAAAAWRPGDVQKALRWALFFEEVVPRPAISSSLPRSLHRARFRFRLFHGAGSCRASGYRLPYAA